MKFFSMTSYLMSVLLMLMFFLFFIIGGSILNFSEIIIEWEIFNLASSSVPVIFIVDYLSLFFLSVVSLISGSVLMFSVSYMSSEKHFSRFIIIVLLFISSMFLLIMSPNLISLLLGWDGLGVTSYLLVIFYQSSKSYNAGMITALTNRMGDVGILICIGIMFSKGHWTFSYLGGSRDAGMYIFMIILILSACTKSAQVPFSAWLPAAMAAPTPVSALVHSSTLVTAGVYLLIRFNYLLASSEFATILLVVGILTMVLAGSSAMMEMDMKKIIALSTLSQLGVMMMVLGAQEPGLAFFHLLSHAYFKAMLFMCAGMVIHNMKDFQDIRSMGGVFKAMPTVFSIMMVANLSLCGLPFMSGFYSKDLILESIMMMNYGVFVYFFAMAATFLTVAYSCRLAFLLGGLDYVKEGLFSSNDYDHFMLSGMVMLLPFSIFGGMHISWNMFSSTPMISMPFWFKLSILLIIISGLLFMLGESSLKKMGGIFLFFTCNMWFLPPTMSSMLSEGALLSGKMKLKLSESTWLEYLIFQNLLLGSKKIGKYSEFMNSSVFLNTLIVVLIVLLLTH